MNIEQKGFTEVIKETKIAKLIVDGEDVVMSFTDNPKGHDLDDVQPHTNKDWKFWDSLSEESQDEIVDYILDTQ